MKHVNKKPYVLTNAMKFRLIEGGKLNFFTALKYPIFNQITKLLTLKRPIYFEVIIFIVKTDYTLHNSNFNL